MFFVIWISSINRGRCWQNLVHRFPNKFAATWGKRFPPNLNNVSTLPCETWNARCALATVELLQTPEFISQQLWPPSWADLNPVDNSMWEILPVKVYKTRVTTAIHQRNHMPISLCTKWSNGLRVQSIENATCVQECISSVLYELRSVKLLQSNRQTDIPTNAYCPPSLIGQGHIKPS